RADASAGAGSKPVATDRAADQRAGRSNVGTDAGPDRQSTEGVQVMVRDSLMLTRRSGRAVTAGLLAALLLNLGCLGTETRSWFASKPEAPPPANDMAVMYYKQVRYIPDPTKGGTPSAALTLRMYLFKGEKFGEPIIGEGTIIVDVYDDNKPAGRDGSVPVERTEFPKELLPKMLQKDVLGRQGGY